MPNQYGKHNSELQGSQAQDTVGRFILQDYIWTQQNYGAQRETETLTKEIFISWRSYEEQRIKK